MLPVLVAMLLFLYVLHEIVNMRNEGVIPTTYDLSTIIKISWRLFKALLKGILVVVIIAVVASIFE